MLTSRKHIDGGELFSFAAGREVPTSASQHVQACDACRGELDWLQTQVGEMRADRTPEPPLALVHDVQALFQHRPSFAERVVETLAALLRGPAQPALAVAGVRGGRVADRYLFTGEGLEVDVEVALGAAGRTVTGQALANDDAPLPVVAWIEAGGRALREAAVDQNGVFSLDQIPLGRPVDLVLDLGPRRLRLVLDREGHA